MARSQSDKFAPPPSTSIEGLVRALQNPDLFDHPVKSFSLIETHISWVLLTGHYAYKFKKPVKFGFIDFSTLDKRRHYCTEELRLNRRFSPDLYVQVLSICGSQESPRFGDDSEVFEYAVKMREFPQSSLLSEMADDQRLRAGHIDGIADVISSAHNRIGKLGPDDLRASPDTVLKWSAENFDQIEAVIEKSILPEYFRDLKTWCLEAGRELLPTMKNRLETGFVRECHGDLHLSNIALINNQITLFDCIEFNPELSSIDTMSEIAFVAMDLQSRAYVEFARRFINRYLASTGDYEGVTLLRYYFVYRCLVRAKVEALRARQENEPPQTRPEVYRQALQYLELAQSWVGTPRPALVLMHGVSGSGKSTLASQLAEQLGAIQIRSDIERKRLFAIKPLEDSASSTEGGIYTKDATQQTYNRLSELAGLILKAGFTVIVDASFLKRRQRDQFRQLARSNQSAHLMISCEASEAILRERILRRGAAGEDPSEANLEVLNKQLQTQDTLGAQHSEDAPTFICNEATLHPGLLQAIKQEID